MAYDLLAVRAKGTMFVLTTFGPAQRLPSCFDRRQSLFHADENKLTLRLGKVAVDRSNSCVYDPLEAETLSGGNEQ